MYLSNNGPKLVVTTRLVRKKRRRVRMIHGLRNIIGTNTSKVKESFAGYMK